MRKITRLALMVLVGVVAFVAGVFMTRSSAVVVRQLGEPSPWQVMLSFENQDLAGLNEESASAVQKAITKVTGMTETGSSFGVFEPRLFRTISNTKGEQRYILVEEAPAMIIPGSARLRIHIFDTRGRLLGAQEFSGAHRNFIVGMKIRQVPVIEQQALIFHEEYCFSGTPSHRFFVLIGDEMRLVHSETYPHGGTGSQSSSYVGPTLRHSIEEWERDLHSAVDAEVMSVLVWLRSENPEDQESRSRLLSSDRVRKRLVELSQSEDQWTKWDAQAILER